MKNKSWIALAALLLGGVPVGANAQDSRERHYYYEILSPSHEPKAPVEGFATTRVGERLDRGLTILPGKEEGTLYLSWRLLQSDAPDVAFNVYREVDGKVKKLNRKPLKTTTDFVDESPAPEGARYQVATLDGRGKVLEKSPFVAFAPESGKNYLSIKLNRPVKAGKVAVADLNGDGVYDYIIRTPESNVDPGMPGDLNGKTYQIEAYLSDGTFLWSKDLGQGIEPGIWYSPYVVYDFNGDGKAEVALKTAPDNVQRDAKGRVDTGEEYLSVLDGMTGEEIARVDWPERNFRYGNLIRRNRNQIGMAFLDGKTPYILA